MKEYSNICKKKSDMRNKPNIIQKPIDSDIEWVRTKMADG